MSRPTHPPAAARLARAVERARGGDIDLLVVSQRIGEGDRTRLQHRLHRRLGEQRIDLVIVPDLQRPFAQVVLPGARPL